ncbi:MAG TPA: glutamine--fructose-6-phosphate transaminase (isomerizing) [Stellaceae bacterium]|nr:glutamine--fructose-6-phosphate transaminase (isomerizing) [Stellaceae bacterium]
MCGIIGINSRETVAPKLLDGLRRLEYRGYDSAGVATLADGRIERCRAQGKLTNLVRRVGRRPMPGTIGIGHTRWATHGLPTETNAHPIATERVAVVHNGIIENFQTLRRELTCLGHRFHTETDTEAVAVLATEYLNRGFSPTAAVRRTLRRLEGAFALVFLFPDVPDLLICARRGSPLVIGYGEREMLVGSDELALGAFSRRVVYLEEGDWAVLTTDGAVIFDATDNDVDRPIRELGRCDGLAEKNNYRHFMQKEIFEQPAAVSATLQSLLHSTGMVQLPELPWPLGEVEKFGIIACGTSWHAGLVAKYWLERIARVPVEVDIASEFRYREPPLARNGAAVFISQSGETADTLAALRYCREHGQKTIAIVNQPNSSIAREADVVLPTLAGPEIGVASTKAFMTQLAVLACLTLATARVRGTLDGSQEARLTAHLLEAPTAIAAALTQDAAAEQIAGDLAQARDVIYLGRGSAYPLALEGALKLKEISYIHAEGYAAGEMKHGPIALIDNEVPVIAMAPPDHLFPKALSNIEEVLARGGRVVMISDAAGIAQLYGRQAQAIAVPECDPFVAPLVYTIPVQLLAYHTAALRGTDIDQPRNLAKSVTVE